MGLTPVVAALALAGMLTAQPPAEQSVDGLIRQLRDEHDAKVIGAAEALMAMGAEAKSAIPALLDALHDEDSLIAISAINALAAIGPHDPDSVPNIETELGNRVFLVGYVAARGNQAASKLWGDLQLAWVRAHGRLRVDIAQEVDRLIQTLHSDDHPDSRARAAEILADRGEDSDPVLTALRHAIESRHPNRFRFQYQRGNGRANGLVTLHGNRIVRLAAARAIRRLVPSGEEQGASVMLLREGSADEALRSVYELRQLSNPTAEPWVLGMCYRLDNADLLLTREIISALGTFGAEAEVAIQRLEQITEHEDPQIAERVKVALRQIRG